MYDAIVIGGGAAGLSAALVLGRSRRRVLLCDDGSPRNAVAEHMHGYLSRDGTPPMELLAAGRAQLQRYASVEFRRMRVDWAQQEAGTFRVRADGGETYETKRLLLATGVCDALPDIEGLKPLWGRSVFVCPYCDGWEMRDRRIGALGKGRRAVELAQELRQWSRDIFACLEGVDDLTSADRRWLAATNTTTRSLPVKRLHGIGPTLRYVEFDDGMRERCDALFLTAPLRQHCAIATQIGCALTADGAIAADARGRTSVPGCFAAGDAMTNVHQVALAAASGVVAAMAINEALLKEEIAQAAGTA